MTTREPPQRCNWNVACKYPFLKFILSKASADGNKLYYVYCVRTSDGTWRIKEM